MFDTTPAPRGLRTKHILFAFIALMMAYVISHNERFLIDPAHPIWQHYEAFKWWLLVHGVAGACAVLLAPMQFSDRLRSQHKQLHRVTGRVYVASVFVLAPLGIYIELINGGPDSMAVLASVDAALLMITTGVGLVFALKRMIPQHRQWMTRSYAVALVFFEGRFLLGVTGLDQPLDFAIVEPVIWACLAFSVLAGDIANQIYDLQSSRLRPAKAPAAHIIAASTAGR
jgi:uncharacterized membrane protein